MVMVVMVVMVVVMMMMTQGVDYVNVDATNLPQVSHPQADVIQIRPVEVLFDEWARLRAAGVRTPAIAMWPTIPTGADCFRRYLALYNQYPSLYSLSSLFVLFVPFWRFPSCTCVCPLLHGSMFDGG